MPQFDWEPTPDDVGSIIRARTKDSNGNEVGTFNADTRPTADQVYALIETTCADIDQAVGAIPVRLFVQARRCAAIGSAAEVELSFWPEQIRAGRSPYPELKARYDELLQRLSTAVAEVNDAGDVGDTVDLLPEFNFDPDCGMVGLNTPW